MTHRIVLLLLAIAIPALAADTPVQMQDSIQKEATVTHHAKGPFDVKLAPQDDKSEDATLGRMILDKQYHGDIEGTGKGQMLTGGTSVKGSGVYVAIERVTATLQGHSGSFLLQHGGVMTRGEPHLAISVVPDSGTGDLTGITGKMDIQITNEGKHFYDFEYSLPETH